MSRPGRTKPRTFFPTAINVYRQCPERYFHRYIMKRKGVTPFSRPMAMGGATHRLIASVLPQFMQTGAIPDDLDKRALDEISTTDYPQDEVQFRTQDVRDVVEWTHTALEMIPTGSTSLFQERRLYARLGRSEVEIGAQIDLVLERPTGEVEHVDFKTGKVRDNTVQSIMARAVVGRRFQNAPRIISTTLYVQHRERQSDILDRDTSKVDWAEIVRDIRNIRHLDHFPANPGPLCDYCPFQARRCTVW